MRSNNTPRLPIRLPIATARGDFTAEYTGRGLASLDFPCRAGPQSRVAATTVPPPDPLRSALGLARGGSGQTALATVARTFCPPSAIRRWHALTTQAVNTVLAGKPPPHLPPLDLTHGTAFQQSVWGALLEIATGQTRSYGQIAATIGRPKATRAVGTACGANPIPLLIPCHRVLAAGGGLAGFTGGLEWKRLLLEREGVLPPVRPRREPATDPECLRKNSYRIVAARL